MPRAFSSVLCVLLQELDLEPVYSDRPARLLITSILTHHVTPVVRYHKKSNKSRELYIFFILFYFIDVTSPDDNWLFIYIFRHNWCISGSSLRSAVRVWRGQCSFRLQGRWWPALRAIQDSSPTTLPPVNHAHMASIQMEQVERDSQQTTIIDFTHLWQHICSISRWQHYMFI